MNNVDLRGVDDETLALEDRQRVSQRCRFAVFFEKGLYVLRRCLEGCSELRGQLIEGQEADPLLLLLLPPCE